MPILVPRPEELIETVPAKAKSRSANLVKTSPIVVINILPHWIGRERGFGRLISFR